MHHFMFALRSGVLTDNRLGENKCQCTSIGFPPWIIRVNREDFDVSVAYLAEDEVPCGADCFAAVAAWLCLSPAAVAGLA